MMDRRALPRRQTCLLLPPRRFGAYGERSAHAPAKHQATAHFVWRVSVMRRGVWLAGDCEVRPLTGAGGRGHAGRRPCRRRGVLRAQGGASTAKEGCLRGSQSRSAVSSRHLQLRRAHGTLGGTDGRCGRARRPAGREGGGSVATHCCATRGAIDGTRPAALGLGVAFVARRRRGRALLPGRNVCPLCAGGPMRRRRGRGKRAGGERASIPAAAHRPGEQAGRGPGERRGRGEERGFGSGDEVGSRCGRTAALASLGPARQKPGSLKARLVKDPTCQGLGSSKARFIKGPARPSRRPTATYGPVCLGARRTATMTAAASGMDGGNGGNKEARASPPFARCHSPCREPQLGPTLTATTNSPRRMLQCCASPLPLDMPT